MTPRFPSTEAPDSEARQTVENALLTMHGGPPPFQWIDEDGHSMLGCYAPLCYSPIFVGQFFTLAKTVYDSSLVKPRNRELAILGLTSVLDVPYIVYCHRGLAGKVGVTDSQYQEGMAGNVPQGLSDEEAMAYRLGRILPTLTGPLDNATWEEAASKMEKSQIVGVLHTVAGYRWVAMLEQLNGDVRRWT
ncbi:hypothetical protein F4781DRAFT_412364 [Annulohypoxylon bovei var. microspora]|nr:hypothetical protein F4781DRAFT_412364 [Annulohypoxylon bovei var. microspora]